MIPKTKRHRNRKWLDSFAERNCEVCGAPNAVAAHIRCGHAGGTSLKPDDWRVIALCHRHHDEFDREWAGDPLWLVRNILDPILQWRYDEWVMNQHR